MSLSMSGLNTLPDCANKYSAQKASPVYLDGAWYIGRRFVPKRLHNYIIGYIIVQVLPEVLVNIHTRSRDTYSTHAIIY